MKLLNYTVEADLRSLRPITHFKIHNYDRIRFGTRHLVWWKLSLMWGKTAYCEHCGVETGLEAVCQDCYDHHYCECGTRLEDASGSPGDGLCRACS